MTNSDGIDPDHCQNVLIENTNISAADDCIVLKTTEANKKYGDTKKISLLKIVN
ncbi:MAG: glycosyl hydrolase family 28 protein [Clostridium sp.]|nr:MAG: glycosyl hydrolase family 28 protein [Clostridium sp.]